MFSFKQGKQATLKLHMKRGMLHVYRMMQRMFGFLGWIIDFYAAPNSR
jgi:hypothetical protein